MDTEDSCIINASMDTAVPTEYGDVPLYELYRKVLVPEPFRLTTVASRDSYKLHYELNRFMCGVKNASALLATALRYTRNGCEDQASAVLKRAAEIAMR